MFATDQQSLFSSTKRLHHGLTSARVSTDSKEDETSDPALKVRYVFRTKRIRLNDLFPYQRAVAALDAGYDRAVAWKDR